MTLQPDRLVATAIEREGLDTRARYNLACYYARTAARDDRRRRMARQILTAVMRSTHGAERRALTNWAWKDPGLRPAIERWTDAEDILGARPARRAPLAPPELERIAAIGGYAIALAEAGIHSPEALQRTLRAPDSAKLLADALQVDPSQLQLWADLLELLEIEGIGPTQLNLLEAAGVTRIGRLVRESPETLHRRLVQVNRARRLVQGVPSAETLAHWQRKAAV